MNNSKPQKSFNLYHNFIKFCLASGLNIVLIFLGTYIGHEYFGIDETYAYSLTIILVFFVNFFSLRYFVYPEANKETDAKKQAVLTAASSLCFRLIEILAFYATHELIGFGYLITIVMIQPIAFVVKFIFYRWVIFLPSQFVIK